MLQRHTSLKRPLVVLFAAITLDAVGIGLIFPILPRLLQSVTHVGNVAPYIGITTAIYACMQFVFSPVLGALSDRLGRRAVMLISLGGAVVSYVCMACAFNFGMLLFARAVAGLTSANVAVATAYITDITPEERRAGRFGLLNAVFGVGFIIGPVIGGLLGDYGLRLPFVAAALLNGCNLVFALLMLPETRMRRDAESGLATLNPLQPMRWAVGTKGLWPLIAIYFVFTGAGEAYGTCWALWGTDAFHWNGLWIGLSLGTFGLFQTLVQVLAPGPAVELLGQRAAILVGVAAASVALIVMAFAKQGWVVFAIMPVLGLSGIGAPALQAIATRQVDEDRQGQFQGVLASAVSLASIVGPLAFSAIYFAMHKGWPGAIWLSVVAVHAAVVPLVLGLRLKHGASLPD